MAYGKGGIWQTTKAVAWGFLGVRGQADMDEDVARLSPLQIIAVGIVGALVFVGGLAALVHAIV